MPLFLFLFSSSFLLQYLRFSQPCFGGFRSYAMWRSVVGLVIPNALKVIRSFETSGITNPSASHLIENLNLSSVFIFSYCWSSSFRNVSLLAWILAHLLFLILDFQPFFHPTLFVIFTPIFCSIPLVQMNSTFTNSGTYLYRIQMPCGYFAMINRPLILTLIIWRLRECWSRILCNKSSENT